MKTAIESMRWNEVLEFPGGSGDRPIVCINRKYLSVSPQVYNSLLSLAGVQTPMGRLETAEHLARHLNSETVEAVLKALDDATRQESVVSSLWSQFLSGLVRIPLWKPSLALTQKLAGRVFNPLTWAVWAGLVLSPIVFTVSGLGSGMPTGFEGFRLPTFSEALLLWLLAMITTWIHEVGHFLTAAHFGVRTRSVGLAIFYLQPAGYADVTEAWVKPKSVRVAIALGGLWLQLPMATLGLGMWAFGGEIVWAYYTLLNLASMLFNLVPFVRLDGYWILCHLIEEPNLFGRAFKQLRGVRIWADPVKADTYKLYAVLCSIFVLSLYAGALYPLGRFALSIVEG